LTVYTRPELLGSSGRPSLYAVAETRHIFCVGELGRSMGCLDVSVARPRAFKRSGSLQVLDRQQSAMICFSKGSLFYTSNDSRPDFTCEDFGSCSRWIRWQNTHRRCLRVESTAQEACLQEVHTGRLGTQNVPLSRPHVNSSKCCSNQLSPRLSITSFCLLGLSSHLSRVTAWSHHLGAVSIR